MLRPVLHSIALVLSLTLISGCQPKPPEIKITPPKVAIATPTVKDVAIYLTENASLEAVGQATVTSRVNGIIGEMLVGLDKPVDKTTQLFQIADEEYVAKVNAAQANVLAAKAAETQANAALTKADSEVKAQEALQVAADAEFMRMEKLHISKAISQSEFDSAKAASLTATAAVDVANAKRVEANAQIEQAKAQVSKSNADLEDAQLKLSWTKVMAPIEGRVAKPLAKAGNLVQNGTELVEIIKSDPIWANFNVRESFIIKRDREGKLRGEDDDTEVELQRSGDDGFPFKGKIDFINTKIDESTGTLAVRAVFPNPKENPLGLLVPGFFVRVRIKIDDLKDAVLVPEKAINRDQTGKFVYTVDSENKAVRKNVEVGTTEDGLIVVLSGVSPTDKVITDGLQRVRPGVIVNIEN
ncbi:efflux RND transporter periplasmic adaptor subunit [bacterium]|nr:efflux RND transporter periplasmic adaptor subunit [bacterium]